MTQKTESNYKKFDNEQDKPFFAAYLNTAKQNIFIILRDISESLGLGFDLSNDDNMMDAGIWTYLKNEENKESEITKCIIEKLAYHFPFTGYFTDNYSFYKRKERQAEPNDYFEVFNFLIKQLYEYRNLYSHAVHDQVFMKKEIILGMCTLFDTARREIKKRFKLKTEEVNHLVRLGKNGKIAEKFHYHFSDKKGEITEKGLAFFICLWLQRKYAQLFLKKLYGFKRSEYQREKATLETFTNFTPRVPQPRLTSDNRTESRLIDMVNELKRCPKELYPLLSNDDREKFKTVPEEISVDNNHDEYEVTSILKRSSNRFFYFALRYLDDNLQNLKFHIDLGNYCFHVYDKEIEGINRKRRWIKRMTSFGNLDDFSDENRPDEWAKKTLKLEDRKVDYSDIYVTDTTPHYHINEQNIGIKFIYDYAKRKENKDIWPKLPDFDIHNKTNKPKTVKPDCWLSLYELPSIVFYNLLQQQGNNLPTVEKIIKDHWNHIREFFKNIENEYFLPDFTSETLKTELRKHGLEKAHIPKAIVKYLISKPVMDFETKALKRLKELINDTVEKLDKVKRQEKYYLKKNSSKDYIEMKCGRMADFMARDMIRLQKPLDGMKGKPNSTEFQVLQSKLAFFGKNKESLYGTFQLFNLTNSQNSHPFLDSIYLKSCKGILDFYKKYLELRLDFLKQCMQDEKYEDYHFLKLGEKSKGNKREYIVELAKKYQKETVMNLPRGLFLEPIRKALKANTSTQSLASEIEKKDRVNIAYIIGQYLKLVMNDESQEFYSYKRTYEFLNKLFDSRKENEKRKTLPEIYFNIEELAQKTTVFEKGKKDNTITRLIMPAVEEHYKRNSIYEEEEKTRIYNQYMARYNDFTDNEKQIRLTRTCDEVLFMMVDDVFRKNFIVDRGVLKKKTTHTTSSIHLGDDFKLALIKPDSDKGFLSLKTTAKLQMSVIYETNVDKVRKMRGAKSKLSSGSTKTIVRETVKIKNYGDFRALLKDRRINSLLPYVPDDEIAYEAIQKELELYEKARMEVFYRIFRFEKEITGTFAIPKNKDGYIYHTDILKQKISGKDERFHLIKELRNAFSHSNYPAYILFKDFIKGTRFNELGNYQSGDTEVEQKSIIMQFKNLLVKYYDELTQL